MDQTEKLSLVLAFNEAINQRDIIGLASLMHEEHTFIERSGSSHGPKSHMVEGWKKFFEMFPVYRNTFTEIKGDGNHVYILGHAYWSETEPYDPVIWTAVIEDNLIREWRIYEDTAENRKKFGF